MTPAVPALVGYLGDGENWSGPSGLGARLVEHVGISALSLLLAVVVAIPLGLVLGHTGRGALLAINIGNVGRAVPTFALVVLFVLAPDPLGSSTTSFVLALVLFTIPPLLTNTYTGVREVDRAVVDAGRGLGMGPWQLLTRIEVPLATPLIISGLRLAAVQVVSSATVLGLAGGPALGRIINAGFVGQNQPQLLAGAFFVAALALLTELGLGVLERRSSRTGVRAEREGSLRRGPSEAGNSRSAAGARVGG